MANASYDYGTQAFTMFANGLNGLSDFGDVIFAATSVIERDTGKFQSGSYALFSGAAGLPALSISPFTVLLAGTVIDMKTEPTAEIVDSAVAYLYFDLGVSLLTVDFFLPIFDTLCPTCDITSFDYLTLNPLLSFALAGRVDLSVPDAWSRSFNTGPGPEGYELVGTRKISEPGTLSLLGAGLLVGIVMRRRNSAAQSDR